ncbi:hypothetical protein GYMLUDRAFT_635003 [Collybiopsis luxurians FD-317 M1]|nr:hypothetical protein GYMLUDRAFT_635003 [Collybiopsis luxurians FD-317 M1]
MDPIRYSNYSTRTWETDGKRARIDESTASLVSAWVFWDRLSFRVFLIRTIYEYLFSVVTWDVYEGGRNVRCVGCFSCYLTTLWYRYLVIGCGFVLAFKKKELRVRHTYGMNIELCLYSYMSSQKKRVSFGGHRIADLLLSNIQ